MDNKYKNLVINDFIDEITFLYSVVELLNNEEVTCIDIYGGVDLVRFLTASALCDYDFEIFQMDIKENYDVLCLTLFKDGTLAVGKCEEDEFGKYNTVSDVAYIYQEDCPQKLVDDLLDCDSIVGLFGFEDEFKHGDVSDCDTFSLCFNLNDFYEDLKFLDSL